MWARRQIEYDDRPMRLVARESSVFGKYWPSLVGALEKEEGYALTL